MKLLIMGAGYVGMALLNHLQTSKHEVYVTTTQSDRVDELKLYAKEVILLNPQEDKVLNEAINRCDGMIVLIAPQNKQTYEETYLKMAKKIDLALKGRKSPFYLLYTGSTSVYEGINSEWVTEDLALEPGTENGKILLETEKVLLSSGSTCVLRLGGIFGPGREIGRRVAYFSGKELPGTGEEPTNHIHLNDIVAGIAFCLEHRLTGIYNLVNSDHPTRDELYSNLCRSMSLPCPVWNPSLSGVKKGYKVSNHKIMEAGFIPCL